MAQEKNPPTEKRIPRSLLDLSTFVVRDYITVDKQKFELKNRDELSLIDFAAFKAASDIADTIQRERGDNLTADDEREMRHATDKIIGLIVVGGEPLAPRLSDAQKSQIIQVFTQLLAEQREAPGDREETNPTGESKSLGSSGSTEATPSAG